MFDKPELFKDEFKYQTLTKDAQHLDGNNLKYENITTKLRFCIRLELFFSTCSILKVLMKYIWSGINYRKGRGKKIMTFFSAM